MGTWTMCATFVPRTAEARSSSALDLDQVQPTRDVQARHTCRWVRQELW